MLHARFPRRATRSVAGLSAAIVLSVVAGCGGEDQAAKQIQQAAQTVNALTTDGTFNTLNDDHRKRELEKIAASMKTLGDSGPESSKVAALAIGARAQAGLAALESKLASRDDARLSLMLADLRASVNTYTMQRSLAESNSGTGAGDLIKTLQGSLDTNKKAAADAAKAAADVQARVDELTSRSRQIGAQAQGKRDQASSLAATAQGVRATEGLDILKRSVAVRAEADALERQANELATQLGLAKADLTRARANAAAFDAQTRQIQADLASAQTLQSEQQKLADTAGKAAAAAAEAAKKQLADLTAFRESDLEKHHQAAVTGAQKAFELASQSANKGKVSPTSVGGGSTGTLTTAAMQQNYADALVSQARAMDALAGTLWLVAGAQPALPNAQEFNAAAEVARKASDDTLAQARELYGKVRESIDGISDEKLKARLAETSRLLEGLSSKQGIKAAEPAAQPAPGPAPSAPAAQGAGNAEADVKKVIDQLQDKFRAGDLRGIADLYDFESPEQRQTLVGILDMSIAFNDFNSACKEKFGKSWGEIVGGRGAEMMAMLGDVEEQKKRTSSDFTVTVNAGGDSATVTPKQPEGPLDAPRQMTRKSGTWLFSAEGMPPSLGRLSMFTPVYKKLTADIKSGKIESPEQLQNAMKAQMGSLMGGMGGMPAGGGEDDPNK